MTQEFQLRVCLTTAVRTVRNLFEESGLDGNGEGTPDRHRATGEIILLELRVMKYSIAHISGNWIEFSSLTLTQTCAIHVWTKWKTLL